MALQSLIEFEGFVNEKGYWRMASLIWKIEEPLTVRLILNGYASQQAYNAGKEVICCRPYNIEIDPANPDDVRVQILVTIRSLGYLEAKSIPGMEGALDV